jgi:hypothetical protein
MPPKSDDALSQTPKKKPYVINILSPAQARCRTTRSQQWFPGEHGHKLAPSSISEIFKGTKYAHLDEDITGPDNKRTTPSRWPGLETASLSSRSKESAK